jgi:type I restriction-modification system DNA methylase subunit
MAHLFSKIVLKDALKNISIPDIEGKIALLQEWNAMYQKWELQKKKETAFEATYSEKLFGTILGYNDVSGGLYTREKHPKNTSNGQTCDIGLGYYSSEKNETQAVVELKDAGTSIDRPQQREGNMTPIQQGFKYKPLYNSRWVVVSNYYEFRLYRDTYQDYEVWTLADLVNPANDYEKFRTFYLLLRAESLISETGESETEKLLAKVRIEQEMITKKFYKEYSALREELMRDIWKNNPTLRNESVVTITQRIIDRIVFVHFCEDRWLLPQNKLAENLTRAKEIDLTPWEVLMLYFRWIDKGSEKLGIPDGYNGGLFRDDDGAIKNLKVSDDVITKFIELGRYDFSDEGGQLSVEILGHIFEQSISDLESIREKIKNPGGESDEKKVSKRKKDGIFYTPAYIVDYIVRNSLGKYLEEHEERIKESYKLKWDITEKNYRKREIEAYTEYQKILHTVKVLDPACGSGAFLVRVFDFLLEENKRIANILTEWVQSDLFQSEMYFREILKNNIYGVDLNEESVEITKLSLWLKSAVRGKKLETLDNNIKCGNSLIDDPAVAGDKAFNWNTEFANIMASGGFDVIVGNPPYIFSRELISDLEKSFYYSNYSNTQFKLNTYILFIEKISKIISRNGLASLIIPNNWLTIDKNSDLRYYLLSRNKYISLTDCGDKVFQDASVDTVILTTKQEWEGLVYFSKINSEKSELIWKKSINDFIQTDSYILNYTWENPLTQNILSKIYNNIVLLESICEVKNGVQCYTVWEWVPEQTVEMKTNRVYHSLQKIDETWVKYIDWKDMARYHIWWSGQFVKYGNNLSRMRKPIYFKDDRILVRQIPWLPPYCIFASFTDEESVNDNNGMIVTLNTSQFDIKYVLAILNSRIESYWFQIKFWKMQRKVFPQFKVNELRIFPIPKASFGEQQLFIQKADFMLSLNRDLQEKSSSFLKNIQAKYSVSKITRKLEKWWELDFAEFLKETKISISLTEQEELMSYFETRHSEVRAIDSEIRKTDVEIDNMVFDLYGLTEEERRVVLNS